mmetsp:Transcript_49689/g.57237  ORF Transcript_49689/g.57237 Transcript_49689/m.57237 type:complete len:428 (+) Transcript_49689:16-1299(+)|eukprot:CAMPEP_0176432316 /NCGR_PEP_ID=MMETSP0127-20121128/15323_1 /TAXON_ID=938130 /ORGANISM="Platyophrya macrostoma, Strain WH" /LENGTH=427 /DNA_ID=CAMNT_0017814467 /DNA_START=14 /DNA_END=1297 /DNA_ORIENTATION=+
MNKREKRVQKEEKKDKDREKEVKQTALREKQSAQNARLLKMMSNFTTSKPTNLAAQRILFVLENLIEKTEVLSYLDSPFIDAFFEPNQTDQAFLESLHDPKIVNNIQEEARLEKNLKKLLVPPEDGQKVDLEGRENFEEDKKRTENNLRNLIRLIEKSPNDYELIKGRKKDILVEYKEFLTSLRALQFIMLKKLSTSADEEKSHNDQIKDLEEKIIEAKKLQEHRQNELQNIQKERKNYVQEKSDEITKLLNEIAKEKQDRKDTIAKLQELSKTSRDSKKKGFDEEKKKKEAKLADIMGQFNELKEKNKQEQKKLSDEKKFSERHLDDEISNYDKTMEEQEAKRTEILTSYKRILKELKDAEEDMNHIKAEQKKNEEIDKIIKAKRDLLETEEQRTGAIIQAIQNAWRLFRAKKKKKKKGSGGKKKK